MNNIGDVQRGCCVVIGSSKGLGAALVDELISSPFRLVIGVARTEFHEIPSYTRWLRSRKYLHVVADIASEDCLSKLAAIHDNFLNDPLTVIYNAAVRSCDVDKDRNIKFDEVSNTNNVGILGLINAIQAFESYWLENKGKLIGISSINAFYPPILEQRISYGATKAYMDMLLRNLSILWSDRVTVTAIHFGHIGGGYDGGVLPRYLRGSYTKAAKKTTKLIAKKKQPKEVTWPSFYRVYKYAYPILSDSIFHKVVRGITSLMG